MAEVTRASKIRGGWRAATHQNRGHWGHAPINSERRTLFIGRHAWRKDEESAAERGEERRVANMKKAEETHKTVYRSKDDHRKIGSGMFQDSADWTAPRTPSLPEVTPSAQKENLYGHRNSNTQMVVLLRGNHYFRM